MLEAAEEEDRVGQLFRHELAEREQRLIQPLEKQRETDEHIDEADEHAFELRDRFADDQQLEAEDDGGDGQYVERRGRDAVTEVEQPVDHQNSIP